MQGQAIFIASTGQNIGKTTICLGLIHGLRKHFHRIAFMKPVGQEEVELTKGIHVDKDVIIFKDFFDLASGAEEMSPVLFPPGFTRDYLDGKIDLLQLQNKIRTAFANLRDRNAMTVIEGTGHCGVGSMVDLNNAQVAAMLQIPVILVAPGGLGSSFDALMLNYTLCQAAGAEVVGVILNRVLPHKKEMMEKYIKKALAKWKIPLLGSIPYTPLLSNPSMKDFARLFRTPLLSGEEFQGFHFLHTDILNESAESDEFPLTTHQLIITTATHSEAISTILKRYRTLRDLNSNFEIGMILTGNTPPLQSTLKELDLNSIPAIYTAQHCFEVLQKITHFTSKICKEDREKIQTAVKLVEEHVDFDTLLAILENVPKSQK